MALVPYSDSESDNPIEDEMIIGKRGYKVNRLKRIVGNLSKRGTSVQPNPCINKICGNECGQKLSELDRQHINEFYWGMDSKSRQTNWLASCVTRNNIRRRRSDSNKKSIVIPT